MYSKFSHNIQYWKNKKYRFHEAPVCDVDDRWDCRWQIHLLAELVLPATSVYTLMISEHRYDFTVEQLFSICVPRHIGVMRRVCRCASGVLEKVEKKREKIKE
jgi:hypothetical protein